MKRQTPRPTALVVEDGRTQAKALELTLQSDGFAVVCAATLADAEAALAERPFDVVLLDLVLPDSAGLTGVERLSARAPATPIVVLTALSDDDTALEALNKGAEDYLTKGRFDPTLLVRTLRYAIERHRARGKLEALMEELRAKNVELAALNDQKDRFLGIASHDLRNPLGVILGYTNFLLREKIGELNPSQRDILATMRSSAGFMLGLVEDLLDFSAIQAGAVRLDRKEEELVGIVQRNVSVNRVLADEKGISLSVHAEVTELPARVDPRKIEQVLNNLVSNALKYSHPGSSVRVEVSAPPGEAIIAVVDGGVGIPPEALANLFEPFHKVSPRGTAGEKSTGLGLVIVRNIVEAHGGTITVESELGKGSTFRVRLPTSG